MESLIEGFDNIGVAVSDLGRAVAFYRLLGFEVRYEQEDSASLGAGNAVIYIFRTASGSRPEPRSLDLTRNPPGIDHISLRVADADAAFEELRALGVAIQTEPEDQEWGSRTISVMDPDGTRIWFLGPPKVSG